MGAEKCGKNTQKLSHFGGLLWSLPVGKNPQVIYQQKRHEFYFYVSLFTNNVVKGIPPYKEISLVYQTPSSLTNKKAVYIAAPSNGLSIGLHNERGDNSTTSFFFKFPSWIQTATAKSPQNWGITVLLASLIHHRSKWFRSRTVCRRCSSCWSWVTKWQAWTRASIASKVSECGEQTIFLSFSFLFLFALI